MIKISFMADKAQLGTIDVMIRLYLANAQSKRKMDNAILCTIDFSEPSRDVLKYAVHLSKQFNSHITILFTYRLLNSSGDAVGIRRRIEEEAKQNFAALESEVLTNCGVPYDFKIEVGFVSNRVREYAKKKRR